jgi:hypothetical protein
LCSAIAAIVVTAHNFCDYYNFRSDFCDDYTSMGWLTKAPSTPDPKEDERLHLCISHLNMLKVGDQGEGAAAGSRREDQDWQG